MEQKITSPFLKALVIGLLMIIVSLVIVFTGNQINGAMQWAIYGVFIVGIIFSISQYGKEINYNSGFGNYFAHGFKIAAVITLIMIAYLLIFMAFMPEFKDQALDEARKSMQKKDGITQEQIDQAINLTRKSFFPFLIAGALFIYLIIGAIASLIGAAITKKHPQVIHEA
ncbi:hypothetical protein BH09BAC2_BH09BAC2_20970 [soil metagenome]